MPSSPSRIRLSVIGALVLGAACARSTERTATQPDPNPGQGRSSIGAEDLQRSPNVPIEQILAGKVAGVVVARTEDGGLAIRIRGATSLSGSNAPLYVIDGIPIEPGPNGSLTGINPYDIESIKVLKDATDLTMYGSRGANGVIVIKTRRPNP